MHFWQVGKQAPRKLFNFQSLGSEEIFFRLPIPLPLTDLQRTATCDPIFCWKMATQ
jgi:hypothetical protein